MRAITTFILLAALAGSASAFDQPIGGKRLVLKQTPKGERLVFIARDVRLINPARGHVEDPTLTGAVLHVGNPDTAEWARFELGKVGWSERLGGRVFKFRNPIKRGNGSEVRTVTLRDRKRLNIRGQRIGITLDEPAQERIGIVLTSGTRRYCALFGGLVKKDGSGRFAAKNAPPPSECPEPLDATSDTSTTSSSSTSSSSSSTSSTSTSTTTSSTSTSTSTSTTSTSSSSTSSSSTSTSTSSTSISTSSTSSTTTSSSSSSTSTSSTSSTTTSTISTCGGLLICGGSCPPNMVCSGIPCACRAP